jgi:hypothetical protein
MMSCFFFDIDGTLSDPTHRLHHIQKSPKDWKSFFADCDKDVPHEHIVKLAMACGNYAPLVCLSGRSDEVRDLTAAWLIRHGLLVNGLFMRKAGDFRDDTIVKPELLDEARATGFEPIVIFDDRQKVVDAWRKIGIPCAQVAAGDF